jgi:IclR family transcriptional regulator, mhp operon transcriptional activator
MVQTARSVEVPKGCDSVRALTRGLAILRFVNEAGDPRPSEIAGLGVPRPTVYRLLQTLEEEGYVVLSATSNRVRITRLAAGLGDGFTITSRICQAAGPAFAAYAPKVVWPLDVSVYENAAMVIQETTHGRSPLSIDRGMTGYRLPMLRTAAGRVYLAHCGDTERELILDQVRRLNDPTDAPFFEPRALEAVLAATRRTGLAARVHGEFRSKTSSIALPVLVSDSIAAAISIIWARQALTLREALARYETPLREIAAQIAAEVEE